jgi:hypothetical protein
MMSRQSIELGLLPLAQERHWKGEVAIDTVKGRQRYSL